MTYRHSNAARELPIENFDGHTQRYVLIELAHLADNAGVLRYSQQDLANVIGLSRITVAREMNLLIDKGLVTKEKQGRYKVTVIPTGPVVKDTGGAEESQSEADPLVKWLRDKEAEGAVFEPDWLQVRDETYQVETLKGEELPECVLQAIKRGKLLEAGPSDAGFRYAICFNYQGGA